MADRSRTVEGPCTPVKPTDVSHRQIAGLLGPDGRMRRLRSRLRTPGTGVEHHPGSRSTGFAVPHPPGDHALCRQAHRSRTVRQRPLSRDRRRTPSRNRPLRISAQGCSGRTPCLGKQHGDRRDGTDSPEFVDAVRQADPRERKQGQVRPHRTRAAGPHPGNDHAGPAGPINRGKPAGTRTTPYLWLYAMVGTCPSRESRMAQGLRSAR